MLSSQISVRTTAIRRKRSGNAGILCIAFFLTKNIALCSMNLSSFILGVIVSYIENRSSDQRVAGDERAEEKERPGKTIL
jgi:hypothetical protein